jgi:hypothetical protein
MIDKPCACVSPDKWECWALRYGIDEQDRGAIEMDGGPCDCPCHDQEDEESDGRPADLQIRDALAGKWYGPIPFIQMALAKQIKQEKSS